MKPWIIFCTAVSLAILAVTLLALVSPRPHTSQSKTSTKPPWLAFSLYIQQPNIPTTNMQPEMQPDAMAFVFQRMLTKGPENTSEVIGKARGFIIPIEHFDHSAFNIVYLSFDTPEYSGSLSIHAKYAADKRQQEFIIVGGTGSFAFARGIAIIVQTDQQELDVDSTYQVMLQLQIPNEFPG